ncbi:UNVERIFIED_CONTAM: putative membrane protein [Brevibacillus sp. OAP136]
MDKRTLIQQESAAWVKDGVISSEQQERILERYPVVNRVSALPILAAVLFGLGVLAFIASNWSGIAPIAKLVIIFASMALAYVGADRLRARGYARLGTAVTLIGIVIFGAGFFLIGQMYHLSANPINAFYLWFVGALALVWHYKERALFVALQLILTVSAFYGEMDGMREGVSVAVYYALFVLGVLPLLLRFRGTGTVTFSFASFLLFALIDVSAWEHVLTYPLLLLAFYVIAQLITGKAEPFGQVMRVLSYVAIFVYTIFQIFIDDWLTHPTGPYLAPCLILAALIAASAVVAVMRGKKADLGDLIPYAAFLLVFAPTALSSAGVLMADWSVPLIISLFAFSSVMIMTGEKRREVYRINLGAIFFGISCFVAYINFAWDFMDKSVFLLLGGALLLAISFLLERKRRHWVDEARRDGQ